jgi:hypothetical protein
MNTIKRIFLAVFILASVKGFSQTKTIENVAKVYLKNMGAIIQDAEVKGYYLFYRTDKLDKKTYSYELQILDQNLNSVNSKTITGSAYLNVIEGVYNEEALCLKFYEGKTKEISIQVYDQKAQLVNESKRKASQMEMYMYGATEAQGQSIALFPISKVGSVDYRMVKNKSYGFEIEFISSKAGGPSWKYSSDPLSTEVEGATFIYGDENIIINSIIKKPNIFSKRVEMEVLGIDTKTGKKIYQNKIEDPTYELMVLNGFGNDNDGGIYLFGTYYAKGDKEFSSQSLGMFAAKLDKTGNLISKKTSSWETDVAKFLPVDQKGKMKEVGYTYFHDFIRNADGNIYAIGEQYKKQASAMGIASRSLGGGGSTSEMAINDMIFFEFDKDFTLKNVKVVEKEKSIVALPQGAGINGPQILSHYVKSLGGFDYEFLQMNKDKSIFTVGYLDYVTVKGADDKYILGAVTYADSKCVVDQINIAKLGKGTVMEVLPGKLGNFVVVEYNRETKSMNLRMEKIKY